MYTGLSVACPTCTRGDGAEGPGWPSNLKLDVKKNAEYILQINLYLHVHSRYIYTKALIVKFVQKMYSIEMSDFCLQENIYVIILARK